MAREPESGSLAMNVTRIERLFTERAAFAHGDVDGAPVNALVPLDFPDAKILYLRPDWERAYIFAADAETALHVPGVPELF